MGVSGTREEGPLEDLVVGYGNPYSGCAYRPKVCDEVWLDNSDDVGARAEGEHVIVSEHGGTFTWFDTRCRHYFF
jgi:hypothetical protein